MDHYEALLEIAAMDAQGQRADDLGRAAAVARQGLEGGPTIPSELDVRRIMLDVTPGPDGMGHEVFAKNTQEVEALLTSLGEQLEDARAELAAIRQALGVPYEPHQCVQERTLERCMVLVSGEAP